MHMSKNNVEIIIKLAQIPAIQILRTSVKKFYK